LASFSMAFRRWRASRWSLPRGGQGQACRIGHV